MPRTPLESVELEAKLLDYLRRGLTATQVAPLLGVTSADASTRISKIVRRIRDDLKEAAAAAFVQQLTRLEWMYVKIALPRLEGYAEDSSIPVDSQFLNWCLKLSERVCRLTGADAGTKVDADALRPSSVEQLQDYAKRFGIETGRILEIENVRGDD